MIGDPLIGRQLASFRIERLIGRGGMGAVYYGADVALHRPVAIKVIDARYRDDPVYAHRFVQEARAIAAWRHEHIVQIYYAGEEAGLSYFVMEYIDGPDLSKELARCAADHRLMPNADVLRIGRAIADALDEAHRRGVIHRDVKPSNVLLANDGRIVLTDFGLALDPHQDPAGDMLGSAHYIAPEQARHAGDAVPQSDLYSLGVILYQMLTGSVPFDDLTPATVALQHLTQPPPSPRERNPKLTVETERVLLRALHKIPEKRYATGAKLMDALAKTLPASRSPSARRPVPPTLPSRPRREAAEPARASPAELIGRQLGDYRIDALLGRGGMASIYRAFDVAHKRAVAIKIIDARYREDPDYVRRFQREAQAIEKLDHPNVVRLYRHGESGGLLYLAMQYVEGEDLQSVLAAYRKSRKRIPGKDAVRIVRDVCRALDAVHGRGTIHRDVKPSNIMLDKQGRAVLTDFGLALLAEYETRGEIFGSPHYVAPEQAISSANASPQSDLYSVGVILYEMFTGQLPFDAPDPLDVALKHMSEPPRPPRAVRSDIHPELEAVILKALAKEPEDRYPSGAALADAVDRAVKGQPAAATAPPATSKEAPRPLPPIPAAVAKPVSRPAPRKAATAAVSKPAMRRRRRPVLWLGLALITIAASAGIALLLNERDRNRSTLPTPLPIAAAGTLTSPVVTLSFTPTPSAAPTMTLSFTPAPSAAPATTLTLSAGASPGATVRPTPSPAVATATGPPAAATAVPTVKAFRIYFPVIAQNHHQ